MQKTFYLIAHEKQQEVIQAFKDACEARDVIFSPVMVEKYSALDSYSVKNSMLYRCASGDAARKIEIALLSEETKTLYKDNTRAHFKSIKVPRWVTSRDLYPKTINHITSDKNLLKKYADFLGGFPVVLKASGGSHGIGVMKIESLESLYSVTDFLIDKNVSYVMQEFIDVKRSARLIVLGDRVIDSIQYSAPEGDFRSNEGKNPNVEAREFSEEIQKRAVEATHYLGYEFGGVDILIKSENELYVTEVNMPCYFMRCQKTTGTHIAGMMINYLLQKNESAGQTN